MVKKYAILIFTVVLLLCGCSADTNRKIIYIAVMGDHNADAKYFEKGVKKAYADVCQEYKDSGFEIKCEFFDDNENYAVADKITAGLVNDESITAIIASSSAKICESQAYQTDRKDKILICPHCIYDDMLRDCNYDKVFSLNYSSEQIGTVMENIARTVPPNKWAVCYSDDKICKSKVLGFTNNKDIEVVDSVKINMLNSDFNRTIDRWRMLGVEGIVFVPYDESFDLFYRLKKAMPSLYIISDSSLDDVDELRANRDSFNNVYIVDSFYTNDDEYENEKFADYEMYDTWEIHGYNALRIVVDTAVKNNTNDAKKIAEILHKEGYDGELESYIFAENGSLKPDMFSYYEITENDEIINVISAEK